MRGITGRGLVLVGDLGDLDDLLTNTLAGQGSQVDASQAQGLSPDLQALNATGDWEFTGKPTMAETALNFLYYHRPDALGDHPDDPAAGEPALPAAEHARGIDGARRWSASVVPAL